MNDKPEALRLADDLDELVKAAMLDKSGNTARTAAELRRLHAENEQLRVALEKETAARRDAQIQLAAAYEARNRAGIEFRRLAAKENAELVEALKAELAEQARLNGMGSEREARLLALNAELVEALNSLLNDVGRANSMLGAVKARAALAKSTTQGESK